MIVATAGHIDHGKTALVRTLAGTDTDRLPEEKARRLHDAAGGLQDRAVAGRFRLAVDRGFTLPGVGLVVTGTVHAGRVAVGDRLLLSPAGIEARVRGLHAQNRSAEHGTTGQCVALNIAGARVDKDAVRRGDWIVAPELHRPTARLDVRLRLLPAEARALRHWTAVHVHLGAASVTGRVALLEGGTLAPGGEAFAQLVLDAPIGALWGDRFALRDAAAQRTIGGGRVLDPFPPLRRGRTPERAATLAALAHDSHADALQALMEVTPAGVDLDLFSLARNLASLPAPCAVVETAAGRVGFATERWAELKDTLLAALQQHHEQHPDTWGSTAEELAKALPTPVQPVVPAAIRELTTAGTIQRTGLLLHLPGREVRLAALDAAVWAAIQRVLGDAGLDPLLDKLGRIGWLCRVSDAYFILPETVARLAAEARRVADNPAGLLTVGRFREATGIGRHATMPVLEHFDRTGLTRRVPEGRTMAA